MINGIIKLYKNHRELTLLELTYFMLMLLAFAVAGVVALFNQSLGVSILIVPLVCLVACVVNLVAWAVVKLSLESLINSREKKDNTAKAKK